MTCKFPGCAGATAGERDYCKHCSDRTRDPRHCEKAKAQLLADHRRLFADVAQWREAGAWVPLSEVQ